MDDMEEASPLKNVTGGGGCGCGCLGMLSGFLGALLLLGIPLDLYAESQVSSASMGGMVSVVMAVLLLGLGGIMYVGSLFLE